MKCRHCRASASDSAYDGELSTAECLQVLNSLASVKPLVIWTGGEPMVRTDLTDLVRYASSLGIRSVLAPCGMLVTEARLRELKDAGVMACSFSLDGPDKETHDSFRGVDGAWDSVHAAMSAARVVGMPFQINTVVRKGSVPTHEGSVPTHEGSVPTLDAIYDIAMEQGASRLDLFFLVPTGRGRTIDALVPGAEEVGAVIAWSEGKKVKLTCCPQAGTCIGGRGFSFLSHRGDLQTCGFVQTPCGNIRDFGFDFIRMTESAVNPLGESGNCRTPCPQI